MIRVGFLAAGFVIAAVPGLALSADDQALLDRVLLARVRPMAVNTALVEKGTARARLVTPMTGPWLDAAKRVQSEIEAVTGVQLPIISDTDLAADDWGGGNLIVIGNLLVSSAYARLYHNFFVCADAGYTGTEGFELRTRPRTVRPGRQCRRPGSPGRRRSDARDRSPAGTRRRARAQGRTRPPTLARTRPAARRGTGAGAAEAVRFRHRRRQGVPRQRLCPHRHGTIGGAPRRARRHDVPSHR